MLNVRKDFIAFHCCGNFRQIVHLQIGNNQTKKKVRISKLAQEVMLQTCSKGALFEFQVGTWPA